MITPTSLWTASNAVKGRTPIYRVKFAGVAQEFSTQPVKANFSDEVLARAALGYWRFGESSGVNAADSSGNLLTGAYVGAPTLGALGALTGDATTSVTLSGAQYVSVPHNALLNTGNIFSVCIWIKQASQSTQYLVSKGANNFIIYVNGSNFVVLNKNGVGDIVASTVAVVVGAWTFVCVVKNAAASKIYINSADVTGAITDQTIVSTASALLFGDAATGADRFLGSMQEGMIFAAPLSALSVQCLYDAGRRLLNRRNVSPYIRQESLGIGASQVIPERGQSSIGALTFVLNDQADESSEILADAPIGFYRCGDLTGTVATDSSGNGKNGVYA